MFDNEDFINGLYGSDAVNAITGAPVRLGNGLFGWEQGRRIWKNRRVSAVCAMAEPTPLVPTKQVGRSTTIQAHIAAGPLTC
jgi:hypothetical protein